MIAAVVQQGVEFADNTILIYDAQKARGLTEHVKALPFVLEGHSTDYQPASALRAMRRDGIAVLKVGPALTFALREALFALESMEKDLYAYSPAGGYSRFSDVLERKMMQQPKFWERYYHGSEGEIAFARRYSLSDRCGIILRTTPYGSRFGGWSRTSTLSLCRYGLISQYFPAQKEAILVHDGPVCAEWLISNASGM